MAGIYQGQWTGQEIDAAIGRAAYVSNENLLDNWYFKLDGKFPINRRGANTVTGDTTVKPFIDRWSVRGNSTTTFTVKSTGLEIKSTAETGANIFQQAVEGISLLNKTITVSALTGGGNLIYGTFTPTALNTNYDAVVSLDGVMFYIRVVVGSASTQVIFRRDNAAFTVVLAAAKLELGTQQTLAHQEGGTYVLNEAPIYEEQLIRCQTSKADSNDTYANLEVITGKLGNLIVYEGTMPTTAQAVRVTVAPASGGGGYCVLLGMVAKNTNNSWYSKEASMTERDLRFSLESSEVSGFGGQPYRAFILSM